jgi:hypothetical protein
MTHFISSHYNLFTDVVNYFEEMSSFAGAISRRRKELKLLRLFTIPGLKILSDAATSP